MSSMFIIEQFVNRDLISIRIGGVIAG